MRRQSEHLATYAAALERLGEEGMLYRCFRTRRELAGGGSEDIQNAPHGRAVPFTGEPLAPEEEAKRLDAGDPFAWRLSLTRARERLGETEWERLAFVEDGAGPEGEHGVVRADPTRAGDVVLARKDVGVAYHLAVVVDDALQGVSHVIRGCDLFEACHVQRLLQALLGLPTPSYRHHRLLLGEDGKRLAKRNGARALADLRAAGTSPEKVRERLFVAGGGAPWPEP